MDNPFSWNYLTTTPGSSEVFGAFAIGFLILFGLGFLVSLVVYSGAARSMLKHPVLRRMAHRWSVWGVIVFGIGLFFFLIRVLQINPFNFQMRIWLYLSLLAFVLLAAYCVVDFLLNYSEGVRAYEDRRRQQQYLRPSSAGGTRAIDPGAPLAAGARPVKRRRR
ncbi:MAG TPA: hypothetical protein VFL82_00150 [Thermomicrobiales bacterium]|nr:hypothetical protein [Thermomicrobiales bacterium]